MKRLQVTFVGMEPTEALKKYVTEKVGKYNNLFKDATKIEVFLKENQYRKGKESDFRIDINVYLVNTQVRVEQTGEDMYANIDQATDVLARRLKRYLDKKEQWEGNVPWKVLEADVELEKMEEEIDEYDYSSYTPKISVRKKLENMSPMEEGEAIEQMELSGFPQMLFRHKKTDKICMLYKRSDGTYGLVETVETV